MAVTVTLPVKAVSGLTSTLIAGGSLAANTTYYYIVIGYDQASFTPSAVFAYHSPISAEGSFTTDNTNKSVRINWTNVAGATRYQILLTTTSGDYTNSGGYGTTSEGVGNITSGVAGYTITTLSTEIYVFHTCQIVNALPANIDKTLGLIKVDFSTAGNYSSIDTIYNEIVAAGYGAYVAYDGYTFTLKGFFFASAVASVGSMTIIRKRFVFVKGGVINHSNNYIFQFGTWTSDIMGAAYTNGCSIDILNARQPFWGSFDKLKVYGSLVTNNQSFYAKLPENKTIGSFFGGTPYISNNTTEMKDSILGLPMRGNTSVAKDLKWSQSNNFGNEAHIRLRIVQYALMPYFQGGTFYDCKFLSSSPLSFYNGAIAWSTGGYYTDFYDCEFPSYPNGMLIAPYFGYTSIVNPTTLTSNQFVRINYSLTAKVLDEAGNALSGVTVSAVDKDNNPIEWIEHDTTIDKLVNGIKITGTTTTNASGEIDYYVKSYKNELNPANTQYPSSTDIITTYYYPYTITFSKAGYRDYQVILEELKEPAQMLLTLEAQDIGPQITNISIQQPTAVNTDGQIVITATGGTGSLQYSIGAAYQTGNTFTGLSGATYTVSTKDSLDLTDTISGITLIAPAFLKPVIILVNITNPTAFNDDGQIIINASGGTAPYMYSIGAAYQSGNTFNGLSGDTYMVSVKDINNQIDTISGITLTAPAFLIPTITSVDITNPTTLDNDGQIVIYASGGTTPYMYSIGGAYQSGNTFSGLSGGTYTVSVSDSNNQTDSIEGMVLVTASPITPKIYSVIITDTKSTIESTGSIRVLVNGGTAPYQYKLNDGIYQSSNVFSGLPAGVYNLIIRDNDNQTSTLSGIKVGALSIGGASGRGWSRRKYAPEVNVRNVSIKDKDNDLKEEIKINVSNVI